ncbi:hypothetical protein [Modestobacter sp. SYSU DS0290]
MPLRRALIAALATGVLALTGCGSSSEEPAAAVSPGTAEPTAASDAAAAAATADPAAAQDPAEAAVAVALRAGDLPEGWSVQANPLPADADLAANPSLTGICGQTFTSEARRTSKQPVVGLDGTGTPQLSSEAIAYDSPTAAGAAVQELVQAFSRCPEEQYTFETAPSAEGLADNSVVFQYRLPDGTTQVVLAQATGPVLSVLIGEDPAVTAAAGRSIATRMAALPAGAIGG